MQLNLDRILAGTYLSTKDTFGEILLTIQMVRITRLQPDSGSQGVEIEGSGILGKG